MKGFIVYSTEIMYMRREPALKVSQKPQLLSISTAVPDHVLDQNKVAETVSDIFSARFPDFRKLQQVFVNCGINQRSAARDISWYIEPHGWPDRTAVYLEVATDLFIRSARQAMADAGVTADEIGAIVTVSSTGIATPSLEARAAKELGFSRDVSRIPVFGLGCAGGVTGLSIAARLANADPAKAVLLVVVELCTLAVRLDQTTKANIVALALFGDGAAAAVVKAGQNANALATIDKACEYSWPDTLDIMGWSVDPEGFGVIFDRSIPAFAQENLAAAVFEICRKHGIDPDSIGRYVCHPGGMKVIEALESAMNLKVGSLDHERDVLANYGNMSAPTALFVLERVLREGIPERAMMLALGPGFTLSTAMLGRVA